ncbi:hypothetical protein [Ruegeria atlantica]|uniref:hypothetical protein n=1 Tax=Ruegeria atlantica TaxID=81569 RepID=UPI001C2BC6F7|nr:hypothetical protein [Ruegeria atlantica]
MNASNAQRVGKMKKLLVWVVLLISVSGAGLARAGESETDAERRYGLADGCLEEAADRIDVEELLEEIITSPDFANFRETERNRIVLCRELGLRNPLAKLAWPSFGNTLEIHVADTISEAEADEAVRLIKVWSQRVRSDQGIGVPFPAIVIVGDTADSLYPLVLQYAATNVTWEEFQRAYDGTCSTRKTTSGWAAFNHLVICLEPGDKNLIGLEPVFIHEEIHVIQFQLAGQPGGLADDETRLKAMGPEWLLEGMAEFPALVIYGGIEVSMDFDHAGLNLRDLETYQEFNNSPSEISGPLVNAAAATLLEGRSFRRAFEFYEALGKGQPWRDAFKQTFGLSVDEFYLEFDRKLGHDQ